MRHKKPVHALQSDLDIHDPTTNSTIHLIQTRVVNILGKGRVWVPGSNILSCKLFETYTGCKTVFHVTNGKIAFTKLKLLT